MVSTINIPGWLPRTRPRELGQQSPGWVLFGRRLPQTPGHFSTLNLTITTEACNWFYTNRRARPSGLDVQVEQALDHVAELSGRRFGDLEQPLLVSVRSGARASMPGMMDTVLNLGLNDATVEALASEAGDLRFAWDSYRRFIGMYASVVLGLPHEGFDDILSGEKARLGIELDTE